jgi:hypothetical protein
MIDEHLAMVKMQLEYYFGDVNYERDEYLHGKLDSEGYIEIEELLKWYRM